MASRQASQPKKGRASLPKQKSRKKESPGLLRPVFGAILCAYVLFFFSYYLGIPSASHSLIFGGLGGTGALSAVAKAAAFLIFYCAALMFIIKEEGISWGLGAAALFLLLSLASFYTQAISLAGASLSFILAPIYWHMHEGKGFWKSIGALGIRREGIVKEALLGIPVFFAICGLVLMLGAATYFTGTADQQKVQEKIETLPDYVVLIGVGLAPLGEELFFRGLLLPLFGPMGSTLAFSLLHFSYGSWVEIAAAFLIGILLAGVVMWRRGNLIAAIVAHGIYNLISLVLMKFM